MSRKIDLNGMTFDRLLVIGEAPSRRTPSGQSIAQWECLCTCGGSTIVSTQDLRSGNTRSCGCLRAEVGVVIQTHGKTRTPEYRAWQKMKGRCYDPNDISFPNYGGRGIRVCDRWKDDPIAFMDDMGPRPGKGWSLDRIDSSSDYSPENCRWATRTTQNRNSRRNRVLTLRGVTKTLAEWSALSGTSAILIHKRIQLGWSEEDAVYKPVRGHKEYKARQTMDGL
jgi:hypothetical protein